MRWTHPTLSRIKEAFGVERVTKEFFEKYKALYLKLREELDGIAEKDSKIREEFERKNIKPENFTKKLLGQIVFLYFLQKKGWMGVEKDETGNYRKWGTGSKNFLRRLFEKKYVGYSNFFNDVLEPLFYQALAIDRGEVSEFTQFACKIPFLNGGLFEPIGGYNWEETDIRIKDETFKEILDTFDLYNFTVREDEPLEKEVAVDPEMLGKVFENLLEVKDRKSKGAYYTPREIVHYMCQESLISYLDTALNTGSEPITTVGTRHTVSLQAGGSELIIKPSPVQQKLIGTPDPVQLGFKISRGNPQNVSIVPREDIEGFIRKGEAAIQNDMRVVRRGEETETYEYKLPDFVRNNANRIDEALASIKICDPAIGSGAFPVGMMQEIVKAREILTTYILRVGLEPAPTTVADSKSALADHRTAYNFKRRCIQESIYGVDIDPSAADIAKLRLWLSLVVDEDDYEKIKPLPNLDYKIVCGNSLLGVQKDLLNHKLFQQLETLKPQYFEETNPRRKNQLRGQIDSLIKQITNNDEHFDFEVYFSEVFHEKKGFDVVIGNPPYEVVKDSEYRKIYAESVYGRMNLYGLFLHKTIKHLLKQGGYLAFINPKTLLADSYFVNLRKFMKRGGAFKAILKIVDRHRIFENVLQACIVHIFCKGVPSLNGLALIGEIQEKNDIGKVEKYLPVEGEKIWQTERFDFCILCSDKKETYTIFERINKQTISFSQAGIRFTTGKVQWDLFKDQLVKEPTARSVRLIWAENIQRYRFNSSEKRIGMEFIGGNISTQPNIINKTIVTQRTTADEQERRIIATIFDPNKERFIAFSENNTNYLINSSPQFSIEFILGILLSRFVDFVFRNINSNTHVSSGELNSIPIKTFTQAQQEPIVSLVNQIFSITKSDDYLRNPE